MILKTDGLVLIYGMILKQINKMIADVDKDGSGAIDFDEFVHMMTAKIGERDTKEELTKAFQIIDLDKNVFYSTLNLLHSILISLEIDLFLPLIFRGRYLRMILNAWQRTWVRISLMLRLEKWLKKQTETVSFLTFFLFLLCNAWFE